MKCHQFIPRSIIDLEKPYANNSSIYIIIDHINSIEDVGDETYVHTRASFLTELFEKCIDIILWMNSYIYIET